MLTENQLRIFEPLTINIFKEYSIKEIKENSKEKSNNALSLALKKFKDENLVNERRIGRSLLYKINIENDLAFNYIQYINTKKLPKSVLIAIEKIKEDLEKYTSFFSIVVFGSYVLGKQTKDSDLDIAVFIEEENKKKIIEEAIKSSELKTPLEIHSHVIPKNEFLEMLKVDEENLGKQIARKNLLIYNPLIFYSLLKRGVKSGFSY